MQEQDEGFTTRLFSQPYLPALVLPSFASISCPPGSRAGHLSGAGTVSRREKKAAGLAANRDYLSGTLRYEDGKLIDAEGEAVMMGWEAPLMERHAEIICSQVGVCLCVVVGVGGGEGASHHSLRTAEITWPPILPCLRSHWLAKQLQYSPRAPTIVALLSCKRSFLTCACAATAGR